jgi:hypothetical protein
MDDNEATVKRVLDDPDFQAALMNLYVTRVYQRAREAPVTTSKPPGPRALVTADP